MTAAVRPLDERVADRHAVGLVAEPRQREEHELFELAEIGGHPGGAPDAADG